MQRDTGLAQAVTAVLEALFHRDADADELGPGLPHDVAQAAHGLTARHEVIDDEDLVRGAEPLLGDKQRDLLLIGIGKNIALVEAALDVVALVARAMPLASAVSTRVMSLPANTRLNSCAICSISGTSMR